MADSLQISDCLQGAVTLGTDAKSFRNNGLKLPVKLEQQMMPRMFGS